MKALKPILVLAALCFAGTQAARGQSEPINVFGYFQTAFRTDAMDLAFMGMEEESRSNSFALQQANLFLSKPFTGSAHAFLNFEFTNNFASNQDWGAFSVEEAWIDYRLSDALIVKAGLLIPTFNQLNEVKNKTPLLPYVFRPLVYEATFSDVFDLGDFTPERAYVQASGSVLAGPVSLEYAAYAGNSESSFLRTRQQRGVSGVDTTLRKSFGGRVGVYHPKVKGGFSFTSDHDNLRQSMNPMLQSLGAVPRRRMGADLSLNAKGITISGEYIKVLHEVDQPGIDLDKSFYYGTVQYDFLDRYFVYGLYSRLRDNGDAAFSEGLESYSVGAGYRPLFNTVLKVQYQRAVVRDNPVGMKMEIDQLFVAVSVLF